MQDGVQKVGDTGWDGQLGKKCIIDGRKSDAKSEWGDCVVILRAFGRKVSVIRKSADCRVHTRVASGPRRSDLCAYGRVRSAG